MKIANLATVLTISLALAGCGKSFDGPQTDDIDEFLDMQLPEGVDATDIKIQAAQNVGDEIEPVYRTRTKMELELEEDYAEQVGSIGDHPVIKITSKAGTTLPAVLFTRSTPLGDDDWKIENERLEWKRVQGSPVSMYDDYVIEGSKEEKVAREEAKKQEAEDKRQHDAELATARRAFVGTWKASQPLQSNGSVYVRNGKQIGVGFTLEPGKDGFGRGTGQVYDFNSPTVKAENPVTYIVSDDGSQATITFLKRTRNDDLPWYISENSTFTLTRDGSLSTGYNGRWSLKVAK